MSSIAAEARTEEQQVSLQQQANHDIDSQRTKHEDEAAAVGCCCCCCRYGGEGALPTNVNESGMTKKETAETAVGRK